MRNPKLCNRQMIIWHLGWKRSKQIVSDFWFFHRLFIVHCLFSIWIQNWWHTHKQTHATFVNRNTFKSILACGIMATMTTKQRVELLVVSKSNAFNWMVCILLRIVPNPMFRMHFIAVFAVQFTVDQFVSVIFDHFVLISLEFCVHFIFNTAKNIVNCTDFSTLILQLLVLREFVSFANCFRMHSTVVCALS